ncbi:zinc-dependent metalloprotease [Frankia sp. CNm7]|uniref:Zinc-dependent metalloprotease n=1 Tax=Frankia nepalensis TaxID=1836974 RepID=A0A937RRQ2_9ACTN|nr:zinc-dependent metalloprotease [Frankia nepalensis]MBL7496267.1 zinc-dependent metalloprotease [Frankia nepalensis]MBL7513841.1 zinc-dependent metalloprotease [Frankia nepalensis]MBL7517579.1 zinc-dependent metalloprotease [Frankia nepalensis]MBL7633730.1 zinc-dependent metalloprotease [Frankia nepalensis]
MDRQPVDWDLAVATARRLVRPGPQLTRAEADEVVTQLRTLAVDAERHVEDYTHLRPAAGAVTPIAVVDRPEWARSNVAGLRMVTTPLLDRLTDASRGSVSTAVGRRVTGVQLGSALAYLAGKVLGQYEVFLPPEEYGSTPTVAFTKNGEGPAAGDGQGPVGRLSLVAPNIAHAERQLGVVPRDFRLWVCLHEQTHRSQFTAVPWLRAHLESEIGAFIEATDLDPDVLADRLRSAVAALRGAVRDRGPEAPSVVEALQTPAQRAVLDRLQALMTLLEGHADQVMDAVGPKVVPTVADIRGKFDNRRSGGSPLDRFVRRLLGLDMKLRQYRQGGAFVRAVVAEVGVDGFNLVWQSPATLPTQAEIADPGAWMARVLGSRPPLTA